MSKLNALTMIFFIFKNKIMKKNYILFFLIFIYKSNAQFTSIPDEDFEQELINQHIDSDGILNHLVLNSDINTVLNLDIYSSNLHNIIGIEGFTQLESINIGFCYNLTSLDFSNNLNLITIFCDGNSLTSLNVSNNIALQGLHCRANQLTVLDVSNNINLSSLDCGTNQLTVLDVSNNINLSYLYCHDNLFTTFDVSNNINLIYLGCARNQLTVLDVSNNINLLSLVCHYNLLTTLDVSQNVNLISLSCGYNLLTTLDVSQNVNLRELYCYYNLLTTLNIYANPDIRLISCGYNPLTNLTITNAPLIWRIHCANCQLTTLDLSNFPLLKHLLCWDNLLTTLDLSNNPELNYLICNNNTITALNLNNNSLLNVLHCNNNNLSTLVIQNGVNTLLNGLYATNPGGDPLVYEQRFDATNNPNLNCIFVDDVTNCNANWVAKDVTSNYVSTQQECDNLQNEQFIANSFSVYPNPVNNILFIENDNNNVIQKIVVYDLMGKTVIEQNGNIAQIDFSNITKGLYLVKFFSEKEIIVKKIIKK